jgi:hypothetical protein
MPDTFYRNKLFPRSQAEPGNAILGGSATSKALKIAKGTGEAGASQLASPIYKNSFCNCIVPANFLMNRLPVTLLSLLLMASSAPRPAQLLEVFPPEESTQTYVQYVAAALSFRLGEEADPTSVQLFVDGVDVTTQSQIGNTRDWPISHLEIGYTPNFSETGTHRAEVRFRTLDGKTKSYSWSFSIKSP